MRNYVQEHVKNRHVLVVGHADADGHLAAELSRRNALKMGARRCEVFIDRRLTAGYRMWRDRLWDIPVDGTDTVIFVDIMFDPEVPRDSAGALIELARKNPEKTFIVIDHHPVLGLPALPQNLGIWFTPAVYTCCFGPPSWIMVVASICDHDEVPITSLIDDKMRLRALGVERAVADSELSGKKLLRLLEENRWDLIELLAKESSSFHTRVRGRRISKQPMSMGLAQARAAVG